VWTLAARAVAAAGTDAHLDALIDLLGAEVPHDLITVTRYSATKAPEFVKHRHFSDAMVERYLANYAAFDPFHAWWQRERRPGVVALKTLADDAAKRGKYIAEFLAGCAISDELGVMLEDGGDLCLGIFLERSRTAFREREITRLNERFPFYAALHAHAGKAVASPISAATEPARSRVRSELSLPAGLWPDLSARERELVTLVLAGHPTAAIARRLGITVGTAKNHRRRIYQKLDITTERELFLQYLLSP
jgi:DNA-binding CsgD family transcriptional regulator